MNDIGRHCKRTFLGRIIDQKSTVGRPQREGFPYLGQVFLRDNAIVVRVIVVMVVIFIIVAASVAIVVAIRFIFVTRLLLREVAVAVVVDIDNNVVGSFDVVVDVAVAGVEQQRTALCIRVDSKRIKTCFEYIVLVVFVPSFVWPMSISPNKNVLWSRYFKNLSTSDRGMTGVCAISM